jgi:hypothetical protein
VWLGGEFQHRPAVSAVGENPHVKIVYREHETS